MTSVVELLTSDHRNCDTFLVEIEADAARKSWTSLGQKMVAFQDKIKAHFQAEEDVLFPAMERAAGQSLAPVMVMRSEHQQILGLLEELTDALAKQDSDTCLGVSETLMILIQQHNMKEEQILYPMADSLLGPEGSEIVAKMKVILGSS